LAQNVSTALNLFSTWIFILGKIGASVEFILGSDFILASNFTLGSDWILGSNFYTRKNRSLGLIFLGSDFILASEFILGSDLLLGWIGSSTRISPSGKLDLGRIYPWLVFFLFVIFAEDINKTHFRYFGEHMP